jgi:hypothetical protein
MTDLTIAIATCGRPRILNRCIKSLIQNAGMDFKLLILDNSSAFTNDINAKPRKISIPHRILEVSDKIGCCESNNILADNCNTKYIMHMDDDLYIEDSPDIIKNMYTLITSIESPTIIGGTWFDTFYKSFRYQCMKYVYGDVYNIPCIKKVPISYKDLQFNFTLVGTDECLHSMIMDREQVYSKVKWDNKFKWKGDRLDFFLQCKQANINLFTYCPQYFVHDPQPFKYGSISYEDFGGKQAIEYFKEKWKIVPLVGWDKHQYKPGNE